MALCASPTPPPSISAGTAHRPEPVRILLVKLSAVGDVVHCLALLEPLKHLFPNSRIHWLVEEAAAELVLAHPLVEKTWLLPRKTWIHGLKHGKIHVLPRFAAFARALRAQKFDMVLDLQGLYKSAFWTALSRGGRRIGWSNTRELTAFSLTETIGPENFRLHAVDRYLDFIRYLGGSPDAVRFPVHWTLRDEDRVKRLLQAAGIREAPFACVNPVAKWETKLWSVESFACTADRIADDLGLPVVFTGSAEDRSYVETVRSKMRFPAVSLCGETSLKELAALYARSGVVVSTDTGPMHLAAAVGTPVVALFGPTDARRTGPYGHGHQVVRAELECSPCFKRECGHRSCMNRISPDLVLRALDTVLNRRDAGSRPYSKCGA